jgi:hypothetical protein
LLSVGQSGHRLTIMDKYRSGRDRRGKFAILRIRCLSSRRRDVIEDKEDEVVRMAHFIEAHGQPAHSVREFCRSYYPTKVCT